jgi:hypothetical protein
MDHAVVQGMEATMRRTQPVVVEFFPSAIEEFGDSPLEVLRYYRSLGATMLRLDDASAPDREDDTRFVAAVATAKPAHTTLVLAPPERVAFVIGTAEVDARRVGTRRPSTPS